MDAGVLVQPPQILFSIPDGSAPLTYGSNGQFQVSLSGSEGQQGVPHGDTDSGEPVSDEPEEPDESFALQGSEVVTKATPNHQAIHGQPPESSAPLFKSTPSPTRVPNPPLTTTGSVKKLFSNELPTLSPHISLSVFGISTATRGLSTFSFRSLPKPDSSFSQNSVSGLGSLTTPLSFNCLGSPCSSTEGSSTTTSAAQLITVAPAVPANVSNFGVKPSSWYFAIIFGTIGGIALLILLVSFIVFIFRIIKRRRMARNIDVPWAASTGDEEQGRFGSQDLSLRSVNTAIHPQDLANGRLRTSGRVPNESGYTLYNHPIPGSRLFSDESLPPKSERLSLGHNPRPTNLNTLRFLPSHLVDEELTDRAIQEDGAYSFSGRPIGLRRRSRGRFDDTIEVNPYLNPPSEPTPIKDQRNPISAPERQPLVERLRNVSDQGKEQSVSWDRLPTPGRDQTVMEDSEPWASSFKAGLFNAFNALASGLKTYDPGENGPDGDKLTQMPTRRRPSIRHSYMEPIPRKSLTKSPGWVLHERHDGTGTVQFLPKLEKQYDSFQSTPTPRSLLPFGRFKAFPPTPNDEKGEFRRTERLIYPSTPFPPATAMVHPHRAKHIPSSTKRNPISRDSSIYSTSSLSTPKCDPPAALLDGLAGIRNPRAVDLDVVVLEPDSLSPRGHLIS